MTTYIYETIPQNDGEAVKHYEIKQSMADRALTRHPETGEPIRRVILGGYGILKSGGSGAVIVMRLGSGRLLRLKIGGTMSTKTALSTGPVASSAAQAA